MARAYRITNAGSVGFNALFIDTGSTITAGGEGTYSVFQKENGDDLFLLPFSDGSGWFWVLRDLLTGTISDGHTYYIKNLSLTGYPEVGAGTWIRDGSNYIGDAPAPDVTLVNYSPSGLVLAGFL